MLATCHSSLVTALEESGQADDGTPYIAMEFLEGESLRQALTRRGAIPVAEVAEILQQAARGLNAAHKLGIIHRDLKPDNIFLTYPDDDSVARVSSPAQTVALASPPAQVEGAVAPPSPRANIQVKIVDFGIAKLRESGAHTQTGMVLGTPAYMSFEQASGMRSDELDARSDVYSLGVVVYEMLTGRTPFHSDTPVGYLRMHMQEAPPPFRTVKPDLPALPQIESVVMKALTKDRDRRYSSVLEFAREFVQAAQPSPRAEAPAPLPSTQIVSPPAATKPRRFRATPKSPSKIRFAVIAGVVLIVIVAGIWYFLQERAKKGDVSWSAKAGEPKGETRVNPNDGLKYVWIPPGTFQMGCSPGDAECADDEKPPHQVTITKGFWLGQTEVTVGAYKRFARAIGSQMPPEPDFNGRMLNPGWRDDAMPVVDVTWDDARAYCRWAGGHLPTEAAWEYAARAGTTTARYGDLDEIAWYADNSGRQRMDSARIYNEDLANYTKHLNENGDGIHEVGQKRANGFGLYDMLGNVYEWVNDWYDQNYYQNSPSQDPSGPASGESHVDRGVSWGDLPRDVRLSSRIWPSPGDKSNYGGFRCAGELAGP